MLKISLFTFLTAFSTSALATTIDLRIVLSPSSEGYEFEDADFKNAGCEKDLDEDGAYICVIEKVIDEAELPYSVALGEGGFSISKDGEIELGMSYGDYDASTNGSLKLPTDDNGNLIPLSTPLKLEVTGGDHASGAWYFKGSAQIMVY